MDEFTRAMRDYKYWMRKAENHYSSQQWAESRAASLIAANHLRFWETRP